MRILLTGDYECGEFAAALDDLKRTAEVVQIPLNSAAESLTCGEPIDLVVVAQARPGQFSETEIDSLRRAAPLAPIIALLGSWCEGEVRSGSPWPGVTRVYWHQWRERFQKQLANLSGGNPSTWTEALTASPEERLISAKSDRRPINGLAAVISDYYEMAEWLAAACRSRGMSVIKLPQTPCTPIDGVAIVLWDVGLLSPPVIEELRTLESRFPQSQVVVLADFPRPDDVVQVIGAGAAALLSKPLLMDDLYTCLDRLVDD